MTTDEAERKLADPQLLDKFKHYYEQYRNEENRVGIVTDAPSSTSFNDVDHLSLPSASSRNIRPTSSSSSGRSHHKHQQQRIVVNELTGCSTTITPSNGAKTETPKKVADNSGNSSKKSIETGDSKNLAKMEKFIADLRRKSDKRSSLSC